MISLREGRHTDVLPSVPAVLHCRSSPVGQVYMPFSLTELVVSPLWLVYRPHATVAGQLLFCWMKNVVSSSDLGQRVKTGSPAPSTEHRKGIYLSSQQGQGYTKPRSRAWNTSHTCSKALLNKTFLPGSKNNQVFSPQDMDIKITETMSSML